jgi:hypothetical protein
MTRRSPGRRTSEETARACPRCGDEPGRRRPLAGLSDLTDPVAGSPGGRCVAACVPSTAAKRRRDRRLLPAVRRGGAHRGAPWITGRRRPGHRPAHHREPVAATPSPPGAGPPVHSAVAGRPPRLRSGWQAFARRPDGPEGNPPFVPGSMGPLARGIRPNFGARRADGRASATLRPIRTVAAGDRADRTTQGSGRGTCRDRTRTTTGTGDHGGRRFHLHVRADLLRRRVPLSDDPVPNRAGGRPPSFRWS